MGKISIYVTRGVNDRERSSSLEWSGFGHLSITTFFGINVDCAPIDYAIDTISLLKPVICFFEVPVSDEAAISAQRGRMLSNGLIS